MKFTSALGLTVSGSMAGVTGSHNKGGQYFRRRAVPTDPGSSAQVQMRGLFGALSQIWTDTLTQGQRDDWDNYAANVSWVDSLGLTIQLSGINHYVRANSPRLQANIVLGLALPRIDDAPSVNELGVSPTVSVANIAAAVGPPITNTAHLEWSNGGSFGASDVVLLWVSGPQNPGIRFFKGPYILSGNGSADSGAINVTLTDDTPTPTPWSERFGSLAEGQRLFGYIRATMVDGRLSSPVRFNLGLAPTPA